MEKIKNGKFQPFHPFHFFREYTQYFIFFKTKIIMLEFEINIIDKKTGEVVDCYFTEGSSADSAINEAEEYAGYDPEDYDFELV